MVLIFLPLCRETQVSRTVNEIFYSPGLEVCCVLQRTTCSIFVQRPNECEQSCTKKWSLIHFFHSFLIQRNGGWLGSMFLLLFWYRSEFLPNQMWNHIHNKMWNHIPIKYRIISPIKCGILSRSNAKSYPDHMWNSLNNLYQGLVSESIST